MVVRCTAKVLSLLGVRPVDLEQVEPSEEDWYLNLLWIERRKCLLLTHAGTLFPVFVADVRKKSLLPIGPCVVALVEEHLASEGLAADTFGRLDPEDVRLAKTASRRTLGFMNDTATQIRYRIDAVGGIDYVDSVLLNHYLSRMLHHVGGEYVTPLDLVIRRLLLEQAGGGHHGARLAAEGAALTRNPQYVREAREVAQLMDELRGSA